MRRWISPPDVKVRDAMMEAAKEYGVYWQIETGGVSQSFSKEIYVKKTYAKRTDAFDDSWQPFYRRIADAGLLTLGLSSISGDQGAAASWDGCRQSARYNAGRQSHSTAA